ncbi:MAG: hypothetical protein B6D35_13830 [Candidatus Brocadia sp. UTAMX2]|jgi:uncharacterized protein (DUF362 family)|nr:MAG: hypothetical protein B6D35_13830 [Candidatus Brocadia sp. UTAMX2]
MDTKNNDLSRRNFLKYSAFGIAGLGAGIGGFEGLQWAIGSDIPSSASKKSTVVGVKSSGIISAGKPEAENVQRMMNEGMFALTGKRTIADAWKTFFTPEDVVGIKINPIGGIKLSTRPEVVNAIIRSLIAAGVKENNIIIWDRFSYHLITAGFPLNQGNSGVRCYGTEPTAGYDKKTYYESLDDDFSLRQDDGARSLFSTIVTQHVSAIINVPVMKDHGIAGVTLCLKNLAFGAVNNTPRFHPSPYFCDPASAEVCAHPALREKVRLHIVDALQACFDGGPASMKTWTIWNEERLFLGTDPVAIDRIGLEIIDRKRKENNYPSVFQKAKHIATAGKKGLGVYDRQNIDFIELSV